MADLCPSNRDWLEWATERWLDLDADAPEAKALLSEIFRENGRRWLRRDPRRLTRRDVLRRRDPETLRTMIWLRNRKMLRALGVTLRSVPAARQYVPPQVEMFGTVPNGVGACQTCDGRGEVPTVEYADSMNGFLSGMPCPDCTPKDGVGEVQGG